MQRSAEILRMLAAAFSLSAAGLVPASAAGEIGQAAPALEIAEWIKGGPIELSAGKGKHIYVVEFWATWCGPCRVSIPHLSELQKKYKDKGVVVVGVSNETEAVVRSYAEKQGDQMGYAVAVDKQNNTVQRYMDEFGVKGIPHAFVIDLDGRIAWHGHPMALDPVLERMAEKSGESPLAKPRDAYFAAVEEGTRGAELARLTRECVDAAGSNLESLIAFGESLRDAEANQEVHNQTLLTVARAAVKVSKGQSPAANELLAEAWFRAGKPDRAVRYARMALKPQQDEQDKQRRAAALERYAAAAQQQPARGSR